MIAMIRDRRKFTKISLEWLHLESKGKKVDQLSDMGNLDESAFVSQIDGKPLKIDFEKRTIESRSTLTVIEIPELFQ